MSDQGRNDNGQNEEGCHKKSLRGQEVGQVGNGGQTKFYQETS